MGRQVACEKQSETRARCKSIGDNNVLTYHIVEYNQTVRKYNFDGVFVNLPAINYTGSYGLIIELSDLASIGSDPPNGSLWDDPGGNIKRHT